jgi:hypothetical protein
MGQHADDIINGDVDQHTGEWLGNGQGYPRSSHGVRGGGSITLCRDRITGKTRPIDHDPSNYSKGTKAIRKELAILIKEKHKSCTTEKEENKAVGDARQEINLKYGKGWREQL